MQKSRLQFINTLSKDKRGRHDTLCLCNQVTINYKNNTRNV